MALFDWKNDYSVGVFNMDSHHKKLFDIINELHEGMKEGKGAEAAEHSIKELLDYTKYHFSEEEKMMEQVGYSGLSAQKTAHKIFISRIEDFKEEADRGMAVFVSSKLVNTAMDWLKQHILTMDKQYQEEMNSNGIR